MLSYATLTIAVVQITGQAKAELRNLLLEGENGPEHHAIHAEERRLLREAVLRIPAALRIVLVLHDMEELSSEQIARILGLQVEVGSSAVV